MNTEYPRTEGGIVYYDSFRDVVYDLRGNFNELGEVVDVDHWQGIKLDLHKLPNLASFELFNMVFSYQIPDTVDDMKRDIGPNLPWVDEHFDERVSRIPYNPPPSHVRWPHWQPASEQTKDSGAKFTHTYPERFWPPTFQGIRYRAGDLDSVVQLLRDQPYTRQAYFPIWFPEDTGVVHRGRVPCTLGYHFMLRKDRLHCFYDIRSCDFFRHFRDDVYFASRLTLWVLQELRTGLPSRWDFVSPGWLTMHIYSLHVFAGEVKKLLGEEPKSDC